MSVKTIFFRNRLGEHNKSLSIILPLLLQNKNAIEWI